eukprot:TRINITY_DN12866_c0_g1_i1.p1 TRINITY_DN12866_c0_g1~~TRINITY_DN12866_c0_g1_i1.p1  ORF type:complete len:350 (+),score=29.98 TRINITY_DN12866_c0_g1_i1:1-1050(+)
MFNPSRNFKKVVLVTGGLGFIASHMVIHLVTKYPEYLIINYDKVDYCSSFEYLKEIESAPNYEFIEGDILNSGLLSVLFQKYKVAWVIHFAAQTHVDNSFNNSISFTKNNVLGTHVLIECCRKANVQKYVHVSTDEVYGESAYDDTGALEHVSLLRPTNPYAASKAAAEHIVLSYYKSYNFPCIITRSNNIYGPHQFPEKVVPKWICLLEKGWKLPVHGDGSHRRAYLYVKDVVDAYDTVLHKGVIGEVYNISSDTEYSNIQLAQFLLKKYGRKVEDVLEFVEDRIVNDERYYIIDNKLRELGWTPKTSFEDGITNTIEWYRKTDLEKVWGPQIYVYAFPAHPRVPHKL